MIKQIFRSELDVSSLSLIADDIATQHEIRDYKKKIVNKPWGYEYLMFENKHVAVWILSLKKGDLTSMHCHPKKKSSLIVLSGQVTTSFLDKQFDLNVLDAVMIDKGVFHSSKANSLNGALIMEIENPPDKFDLVRLKDKYGREHKGYENFIHTSTDLHKYQYIDFHEGLTKNMFLHKNLNNRNIKIQRNKKLTDLIHSIDQSEETVICFLDNTLRHEDGSVICEIGDIITKADLKRFNLSKSEISENFDTLIIH